MTIPTTMRALLMHAPGQPLTIESVPTPSISDTQVLVKVEACGVCHTDEFLARLGLPGVSYPHVLGHEGAGTVVVVGSQVGQWKIGDRVSVPMFAGSCGHAHTANDLQLQCAHKKAHAVDLWGCYAEYVAANAKAIVRIPDNVSYEKAGPCGCAGATVVAAIRRANVPKGGWVGFSGCGGLGLMGVQVAKAQGYKTLSIDIDDSKLSEATSVGADVTVNAKKAGADLGAQVKSLTGGGLDAHLLVTTAPSAFEAAPGTMRGGGTVVYLGLMEGDIKMTPLTVLLADLRIIGSQIGNVADAETCVALVSEGKVHPVTSPCRLSEVQEIFEQLERGQVVGRKVVTDFLS